MASDVDQNTKTGTVVNAKRTEAFHRYMLDRANDENEQGGRADEIMAAQGERILSAETVDEIMAADAGGTIQMRDVPGTEWEIRSFRPVISTRTDITGGHGYYISCDATYIGGPDDIARKAGLEIGQDYALQTGADLVIYKLRAMEAGEYLPYKFLIHGITTAGGNTVIKLRDVPKRAEKGQTA